MMKNPSLHSTCFSLIFERLRRIKKIKCILIFLIPLTDTSECKPFPISSSFKSLAFSLELSILFMLISTWIQMIPLYSHAILRWEPVDQLEGLEDIENWLFEAMQMWNITNIIVSITVVLLYGIIAVKMLCHCEFSQLIDWFIFTISSSRNGRKHSKGEVHSRSSQIGYRTHHLLFCFVVRPRFFWSIDFLQEWGPLQVSE